MALLPVKVSPVERTLGRYWKELTLVTFGCITLFIYEFCERYVQECGWVRRGWGRRGEVGVAVVGGESGV